MIKALFWWLKSTAAVILSVLFLIMGIDLCRAAYHLEQPYHFIVTFFASNLIILISIVLLAGVLIRIIARLRDGQPPPEA